MIVKLGEELEWDFFVRRDKPVKAVKMREDFLVETHLQKGYLQGHRGDYCVEVAPEIRFPCSAEQFLGAYVPIERSEVDRRHGGDRRATTAQVFSPKDGWPTGEGGV